MNNFRILSLDGGGIKGTFIASVLAQCERDTGKRIVEHFDLITGTSTGGIIALALGLGLPASQILEFYVSKGTKIFPATGLRSRSWRAVRHILCAKYSQDTLRACLAEVFGNRRFGESLCRLLVVSYDAVAGDVHLFKTAHHPDFRQDFLRPVVEVAMATAAAPTYFPVFVASNGLKHLDGGVWANCPAALGVIEAMTYLGSKPGEIDVMSIGATAEPSYVPERKRPAGWLVWNKGLVDLLMQAQVQGAIAQCSALTNRRLFRVNPTVGVGRFALDDVRQISELVALGVREARRNVCDIDKRFLYTPAERFQPCNGASTEVPVSHPVAGSRLQA